MSNSSMNNTFRNSNVINNTNLNLNNKTSNSLLNSENNNKTSKNNNTTNSAGLEVNKISAKFPNCFTNINNKVIYSRIENKEDFAKKEEEVIVKKEENLESQGNQDEEKKVPKGRCPFGFGAQDD